ncbi:MAG: hypothetical protein ACK5UX_08575 [Burkholderiales bacterium]
MTKSLLGLAQLASLFGALLAASAALAQPMGGTFPAPARPLAGMELYLASNPKTEVEARAVLMRLGRDLYARGEFAEIDQVAGQFLRGRSRTPSGLWKLAILGAGIGSQAPTRRTSLKKLGRPLRSAFELGLRRHRNLHLHTSNMPTNSWGTLGS